MTTKIHAVVDANGNPIALKLSEGQAHDGRSANGFSCRVLRRRVLAFGNRLEDERFLSTARIDLAESWPFPDLAACLIIEYQVWPKRLVKWRTSRSSPLKKVSRRTTEYRLQEEKP